MWIQATEILRSYEDKVTEFLLEPSVARQWDQDF